jgi:hypothetical protein
MEELREDEGDGVDIMMVRFGDVGLVGDVRPDEGKPERPTKRVVSERLDCLERLVCCSHTLLRGTCKLYTFHSRKMPKKKSVNSSSQQHSHRAIAERPHIHSSYTNKAPRRKHKKPVKSIIFLLRERCRAPDWCINAANLLIGAWQKGQGRNPGLLGEWNSGKFGDAACMVSLSQHQDLLRSATSWSWEL